MNFFYCIVIGYAFGCIQTSYLVGKLFKKIDIRDYGSGNAGATNAFRVFGKKLGTICLLCDASKGMVAVLIASFCFEHNILLLLVTGFAVVLGHNFPFYMNFKGGKGIAASLGIFLAIDYRVFLLAGIIPIIILVTTKYMSIASLTLSVMLIIFMGIFYRNEPNLIYIIITTTAFACLAFWQHRANIKRLYTGTENKLGKKK